MKKTIITLFFVLLTVSLSAQDIVSSFLGKYKENEQLEVVTIGKKMLELLEAMSPNDKDFADLLQGLESIRILTSNDTVLNPEYYHTAHSILTKKNQGFEELVSVKDANEDMIIMIKESKGTVRELVLLSGGNNKSFNMISLCGKIDLETLAKYSEKLNISGLNKLKTAQSKN